MKMKSSALVLLLLLAVKAQAHPLSVHGCEDQETTRALSECRTKQLAASDAKLEKYLAAARDRARQSDLNAALIDEEQAAWVAYRSKHCGNVYDLWRAGTIRHELSATCMLQVTQERTADVWRAYLTYLDSTPPVLPDPSQ